MKFYIIEAATFGNKVSKELYRKIELAGFKITCKGEREHTMEKCEINLTTTGELKRLIDTVECKILINRFNCIIIENRDLN